ncbi:restriction endonuclease subunit S [Francisella uliginis]|uniref:Type I restriction modification DNA specificity domain-containing protein n=1 Tax=Francisella uliginis TaxID=573570 RepID=A0A1L4BS55_9GAMM|nr:restriction endonuclease subunit S [Francisella uliginis]API86665.1 hypothetical protein F7310_04510 [Francisella uliginis]
MRSNYKKLGNYIQQVKKRNADNFLTVENLRGININKEFMPSVANVTGTDLSKYKVVEKNQFAYNPMHVGRDGVLPISMLELEQKVIVSPAYVIFEVVDKQILLPEYLMMWFRRSEFDRNAWFTTDSSVRGGFNWDDFCELELPIPSIEKQREIVAEYYAITNRIKLNEQLNQKLEETAQAIYKEWFVDFNFPHNFSHSELDSESDIRPYKSGGGEMVWCEELEKEIPKGWGVSKLSDFAEIKAGGDKPKIVKKYMSSKYSIPIFGNSTVDEGLYGFTNAPKVTKKSITVSARGAIIGYTVLRLASFVPIVRLIVITPYSESFLCYLYLSISSLRFHSESSAQGQLTVPDISSFEILKPAVNIVTKFSCFIDKILSRVDLKKKEILELNRLKEILLSKMATVEG